MAILSRTPIETTQTGLPGQEEFGARLLTADVGGLSFTTIYCPNGKGVEHADFPRKLAWMDALAAHFESTHDAAHPVMLCGDFNVCPAPIDSWSEEKHAGSIFHTEEERARFRRFLDWGFRDSFREKHPDRQAFSWWDYRGGSFHRNHGLRIDFLLATPPLMERVRAVTIDRDYRKKQEGMTALRPHARDGRTGRPRLIDRQPVVYTASGNNSTKANQATARVRIRLKDWPTT